VVTAYIYITLHSLVLRHWANAAGVVQLNYVISDVIMQHIATMTTLLQQYLGADWLPDRTASPDDVRDTWRDVREPSGDLSQSSSTEFFQCLISFVELIPVGWKLVIQVLPKSSWPSNGWYDLEGPNLLNFLSLTRKPSLEVAPAR